jgi:hypothetical protein
MEKGHSFILSYIKNIEDQLLWDNFAIGEELTRHKTTIESLIDWMFNAKKIHKISAMAYSGYDLIESALPDQMPESDEEES